MKNKYLPIITAFTPYMITVLRILVGYLILLHGTSKLFGFPQAMVDDPPILMSIDGLAAVMQLIGGAMLIMGCFTRSVAFILSGQMAVVYWFWKASASNWWVPAATGSEDAVLYCFTLLALFFMGSGKYSIDNLFTKIINQ